VLAVTAALVGSSSSVAQTTTSLAPKSGAVGAALEAAIRTRLAQIGVTTCTETAVYVAMYLANKQSASFTIDAVGGNAARRPIYMTMESTDPGFSTRISNLFVGPNCDGVYSQSIRWTESCRVVKEKYFPRFSNEQMLLRETSVSRDGERQVTLTPLSAGCLSTKTEPFLR
jgi:hypothetical protein